MSEQADFTSSDIDRLTGNVRVLRVKKYGDEFPGVKYAFLSPDDPVTEDDIKYHSVTAPGGVLDKEGTIVASLQPPSEYLAHANRVAKEFVSNNVGDIPDTPIFSIPEDHDTPFKGFATTGLGIVATRPPRWPGEYIDLAFEAHLVHERAHTSGLATQKILACVAMHADITNNTIHTAKGFLIADLRDYRDSSEQIPTTNFFMEEAFAEESAARYREQQHDHEQPTHWHVNYYGENIWLPMKYVSTETYRHGFSDSALPAYTIDLISKHTGVDIYSLMVQSRKPESETPSKRKIIQAINSIEPKLYEYLRNTPYDKEKFIEAYKYVRKILLEKEYGASEDSDEILLRTPVDETSAQNSPYNLC